MKRLRHRPLELIGRPRSLGLAPLLVCMSLLAGPVVAEVKPILEAASRTLCAGGSAAHPKRATLTTVIAVDRFESSERVVLAAFYGPPRNSRGPRGGLTAIATLVKADGARKKLRTLKGRQDSANTPILLLESADTALEEGDVIEWDFELRKFGQLEAGGCFRIAAGAGPDE